MARILTNGACIAARSSLTDPALALWLLHIPGAHPFWQHYMLSIVHLRQLPALPPAKLHYPDAAYELVIAALDPATQPIVDIPTTWCMLSPANIVHQFHGCTDVQIPAIGKAIAEACIRGKIFVEPSGIMGAREINLDSIQNIIQTNIAKGVTQG